MSKQPVLEWPSVRLGDHSTVKARLGWKGLKAEEYVFDGPIFLATPNLRRGRIDFDNVDHIPQWRYDESPEIQLREGDVLLVKDGSTLGISSIVHQLPGQTTVNGSIAVVRSNATLDPGYLFYCINGREFQKLIWLKRSGLGVPHLFQADLREFRIALPLKSQQRRIAEILATVDEAIEQTETLVQKWQQMKAGLMHDLFTRGVTPDGQLRPTRQAAPHLYQPSPLGWIPKEWEVAQFSNILTSAILGVTVRGTRNSAETIPLIKMGNLKWGELDLSEVELLSRQLIQDERQLLRPGDFLFNTRNTPELVGKTAVYQGEFQTCTCDNNLLCVRFKAGVDSRFVCQYMSHGVGKQRVFTMATGTTSVAAIYWSALSRFQIPKPTNPDEMKEISDRVDAVENLIRNEQKNFTKLRAQKQGLMQDLLTGRVRVDKGKENSL